MSQVRRAVALGFFDGVHIGHAALLERVKERARETDSLPTVLTFDVHPDTLVFGKEVPLINSAPEREEIIRRVYGIDSTIFLHFNRTLMQMPWQEFIASAAEELGIAAVVVGHDFSFGYRGEGTPERLQAWCMDRGISCDRPSAHALRCDPLWIPSRGEARQPDHQHGLSGGSRHPATWRLCRAGVSGRRHGLHRRHKYRRPPDRQRRGQDQRRESSSELRREPVWTSRTGGVLPLPAPREEV